MAAGVIAEMNNEKRTYYKVSDVSELLGVGSTKAYNIIRELQKECKESGKLPKCYPAGRIPKWYFNKRCMIYDDGEE